MADWTPPEYEVWIVFKLKSQFLVFFQRLTKSSKTKNKNQEIRKFSRASYKHIKNWK